MQNCPICLNAVKPNERYPNYVCRDCLSHGVDIEGTMIPLDKVDIWSQATVRCTVAGVKCMAREAHFGGCVVEPVYGRP